MKNHILILIILVFYGCWTTQTNNYQLSKVDLSKIEMAEIKKSLYDTISVQLSQKQIETLVAEINMSKNTTMLKAFPDYWIFIKFASDSIGKYKIINNHLGEYDSYINVETGKYKRLYDSGIKKTHLIPWK